MDDSHAQSARMEGPLLSHHQRALPDIQGTARSDRLGILPHQAGHPMPRLQVAFWFRGNCGSRLWQEPEGLVVNGASLHSLALLNLIPLPLQGKGLGLIVTTE